jgi:hypothetical protein
MSNENEELEKKIANMTETERVSREAKLASLEAKNKINEAGKVELKLIKEYNEEQARQNNLYNKGSAAALGMLGVVGSLDSEYAGLHATARGMFTFLVEGAKENINLNAENAKVIRGLTADYRSLNELAGGINQEMLASGKALDPFAQKSVGFLSELNKAQAGMGEANVSFTNALGETNNSFDLLFKNVDDITNSFADLMENVSNENARATTAMSKKTVNETIVLQKALRVSSADVSALINREYAFTGEATTNTLEQVASSAVELAKVTGVPMNQIKERTLDVMKATKTFGDIGVDSASRIAAAISQLGMDFQTFENMTKGFMNFDDAASKMGDLSAMFGIQMDAMEMTYLASEDQEEFLFRMREEILDAGLDVENMSKARQRMLADQFGMSIEQMRTFMRGEELSASQEQMEAATDKASSIDGMTAAMENFADTTEGATRKAEEMTRSRAKAAADYSIKQYSRMEIQAVNTAAEVQKIQFSDKQFENFDMFAANFETMVMKPQQKLAELTAGTIQGATDTAGNTVSGLGDLYDNLSGKIDNLQNDPPEVEVQHQYDATQISAGIETGNESLKNDLQNTTAAMSQQTAAVGNLLSTIQNSSKDISINLNGEVLGQITGKYMLNNNITNAAGQSFVVGGGS